MTTKDIVNLIKKYIKHHLQDELGQSVMVYALESNVFESVDHDEFESIMYDHP